MTAARLRLAERTAAAGLLVAEWAAAALFAGSLAQAIRLDASWLVPAAIGLASGLLARSASRPQPQPRDDR